MMLVAAMSVFGCVKKDRVSPAEDASRSYDNMVKPGFPEAGDGCQDRWAAFDTACADGADVCRLADDFRRCLVDMGTASTDVSDLDGAQAARVLSDKRGELNRRVDDSLVVCTGGDAQFYPNTERFDSPTVIRTECKWSEPYQANGRYHTASVFLDGGEEADIASRNK